MQGSNRFRRTVRRLLLVGAAGLLPAFLMRCDKAALNLQEGFFEGLGLAISASIAESGLDAFDGV